MTPGIAIVGMACRYPDAGSPAELWRSVLSQRRAFRRIPARRLRLEDYLAGDAAAQDSTYVTQAAVLDGWEFDRVRFRVAGSTFRSTDLVHWLALEVAADALADAGFRDATEIPRESTGVLVGNTLAGEFSRAQLLRLRWPYVRRVMASALDAESWPDARRDDLLERAEAMFKAPFAAMDEDSLAGGLSNTIGGRICGAFDFGGGGYTVDGACASSLLAIASACSALAAGDIDVALAGGVDLSLDPFELVGFAQTGAFASGAMHVYDERSNGFWPGEGCGFVVLERLEDARARDARTYAVVRGWGISSDGAGSIIRPSVDGQLRALRRAYDRAGFGIDAVELFEGHGTGTSVGDQAELTALTTTRRESGASTAAAIGSVKANIGHTKAAAGVAGVIKAALSVHARVIPPTTACERPHPLLAAPDALLRPIAAAQAWPHGGPSRAAVSALGFGGINAHIVLEGRARRPTRLPRSARKLSASTQDSELLLLAAPNGEALVERVDALLGIAPELSLAELGDLAVLLWRRLPRRSSGVRAAVVVSTPGELVTALDDLTRRLAQPHDEIDVDRGIALCLRRREVRVGLLFPGQGAPLHDGGGALLRRFPDLVSSAARGTPLPPGPVIDTAVAQPAIVDATLAGLALLSRLGVRATVGVGHSLGELCALHWAGALTATDLRAIASARGRAMTDLGDPDGAMVSIAASADDVASMIAGRDEVVVAGYNGPRQTVISGRRAAVDAITSRVRSAGLTAVRLPVSHAFHSPLVCASAERLRTAVETVAFGTLERVVYSTVTGASIEPGADLRALLVDQVTLPVRFDEALGRALDDVDILVEVGPGQILRGMVRDRSTVPVLALDVGAESLRPALTAAGALWAMGCPLRLGALFADRFTRPFSLDRPRRFLANPCEEAPIDEGEGRVAAPSRPATPRAAMSAKAPSAAHGPVPAARDVLAVVRRILALRTELPESAIAEESSLLGDLHLTSIAVSELAVSATEAIGATPLPPTTELANATVGDLVAAIQAAETAGGSADPSAPDGIAAWFRAFAAELVAAGPPPDAGAECRWRVLTPARHPHAAAIDDAFGASTTDAFEPAVLVCLPPDREDTDAAFLLDATRQVVADGVRRCAFLQHGGGAAGLAKTLHLEQPQISLCVIDLPADPSSLLAAARLEAQSTVGFREVVLDPTGARWMPVLRPLKLRSDAMPLAADDVVVVSGGGKGIGAECALALARDSGAAVALLGRSGPEEGAELAANLQRFERAGVRHMYVRADVTDSASVRDALERVRAHLGPVTAVMHSAGINVPARIEKLDAAAMHATLAPKVGGLRNLLAAADSERLRLLVTFGSIIGRSGLRGEAHYALANDWLGLEAARLDRALPAVRCLNVEWSVWSGVGMGERLGTVAALAQQGVSAIPTDVGVELLGALLATGGLPASVTVAGRLGDLPTVALDPPELPLLRFLDRVLVHQPGIELIAETDLSRGTDSYIDDHVIDGVALLPVVLALEAMASVATALAATDTRPTFHDIGCLRPVTVPSNGDRVVRTVALVHEDGRVELAIRSDETGFQVDHVRATCRFDRQLSARAGAVPVAVDAAVELDPQAALYGGLLFQGPRFRRVERFRELRARSCVADIRVDPDARWFGAYLPQRLVLGDPGARDAVMHAIQACIPHERLVPVSVQRLEIGILARDRLTVVARERRSDGETFVYDVVGMDSEGRAIERWTGLKLRRIAAAPTPASWPAALLAPYLERRASELLGGAPISVSITRRRGSADRPADHTIARALGWPASILRRPDGQPEADGGYTVSAAHVDGYTLAVTGRAPLGCDIELAAGRPEALWSTMLDTERHALARLLASESQEAIDIAATRVWAALECMKKAGLPLHEPLKLGARSADGWILLCGPRSVATFVTRVHAIDRPVAIAVLAEGADAR